MRNITHEVKGDKLVITIDLSVPGTKSASGKSMVLASTEGNVNLDGLPTDVAVGVNVYRKAKTA